ncbi:AMP-binding protein [Lentzea jiangxiensis]|uniref:Acyl-CoA synthetase (AMP-forming)/AMP-acid ligase II n=1 Tax=Lentzea jiangxiensis TaxID=641025 RepID=A0A1H0WDE9_9PSEU|nr:AMP-binding protein [Lentzea jiangxiensis]SDP88770.1 Acyl-CoA synthetase (AMP-forming)/AMP-acid ligase II [Lentzea jiangxiensis]
MPSHGRAAASTLAELIDHLDDEHGGVLVHFPGTGHQMCHADVPALAWGVAEELLRAGAEEGSVVGVLSGTEPGFLPAVFGVWAAGGAITVLPVPPMPTAPETVAAALGPVAELLTHVVVTDSQVDVAEHLVARHPALRVVRVSDCTPKPRVASTARSESPAVVQFTSGSTSRPKGVVLSHSAVLACFASTAAASSVAAGDIFVSWVPVFHDFGLITILFGLWSGYELHLFSPWHFIRRPRQVVEHMSAVGATAFGGPNFAYDRIATAYDDGLLDGLDLSRWRLALNGGEPVKPSTVARFSAALAPAHLSPGVLFPVYGMAEATLSVACPKPGAPARTLWLDRESLGDRRAAVRVPDGSPDGIGLVSVGRPVPGMELRLLDDDGTEVADGSVGEIALRGPSLMTGYWDDPDATATAFRDGWLQTGDLGVRVAGELYVTGRRKDMIIVAGRNFYAEDVEDVARTVLPPELGRCVAFADTDRERVVVVLETTDPATDAELSTRVRGLVSARLDLGAVDVHAVPRNTLPRTTSGKWQRRLTSRLFRRLTGS